MSAEPDDWADHHVARWRDHWIDVDFDDTTEAITVRIGMIMRYLKAAKQTAAARVGLQDFEYDTLHQLMIRDTPGSASPSGLAEDLGISAAGMTGRLDALEAAGWIQRRAIEGDRRRVAVEATQAGVDMWRRAMDLRGRAEDDLMADMPPADRSTLAALLKQLTLRIEQGEPAHDPAGEGATAAGVRRRTPPVRRTT